jgi:hypothetical protein
MVGLTLAMVTLPNGKFGFVHLQEDSMTREYPYHLCSGFRRWVLITWCWTSICVFPCEVYNLGFPIVGEFHFLNMKGETIKITH